MQVLTRAFQENEFTWFSIVYGELDDNLILVAVDNEAANNFIKTEHDRQEKKRALFGQVLKNEYKITAEIASVLGLAASSRGFEILNKHKILFYIYSHDNCFFRIEPVSANLLARVIQAVLGQHSYYLGEEIGWEEIEPRLLDLIRSGKEIDIQSDPKKQCVWIPHIERKKSWFWKSFRQGTIIIEGAKARFRE